MKIFSRATILRTMTPMMVLPTVLALGCSRQQPVTMAPPISNNNNAPMMNTAPPLTNASMQGNAAPTGDSVYDWHDVPTGQQIPITRGVFDQSGYQLFAQSGETIVVPFANQNMYVMRFGKSANGDMYFVSDNGVPTLFVPNGGYLENSVAQGARWFPFPQNYAYTQPVYLGIAPSWSAYSGMGWYPGMSYYGGYWSTNPYGYGGAFSPFAPMIGLNFIIGGHPYYGWNSYSNYYRYHPTSSIRMRTVYNYNSVRRGSSSAFGRNNYGTSSGNSGRRFGSSGTGSTGSFGSSSRRFGSGGTGSTGSFGSSARRPFGSGSTGTGSTGSFGTRRPFGSGSGSSTFGSGSRPPGPSGSFGRGSSSGYSSSTRRSSGSFGSGSSSGYGGSFGSSGRGSSGSSSPSFGGSRSSSFGGSHSSGGSFGRRR